MNTKPWITFLTVAAPVVSAIVVALIVQRTNVRLTEIAETTKAASIEVERARLQEQQETRRQQFLENHLPKLLTDDPKQQLLGKVLLFATYPSEAEDLIKEVAPAVAGDLRQSLQTIQREAQSVRRLTGDWTIIISGDKTVDLAKRWASTARDDLKYSPVTIYYRDGYYRVAVGNYPKRDAAEQAAIAVRSKTRPDAYVVALGRWCPQTDIRKTDDVEVCMPQPSN